MKTKSTKYALEIKKLQGHYRNEESLKNSTELHSHESATPFATIHVGDTMSDGPSLSYLGRVEHIHHWIGDFGPDFILHKTMVYVYE